jgi:hypothetical protein
MLRSPLLVSRCCIFFAIFGSQNLSATFPWSTRVLKLFRRPSKFALLFLPLFPLFLILVFLLFVREILMWHSLIPQDLRLSLSLRRVDRSVMTASDDVLDSMSLTSRPRRRIRHRKPHNRTEKRLKEALTSIIDLDDRASFPALGSVETVVTAPIFEESYLDALTLPSPILRINMFRKKGRLFALSSPVETFQGHRDERLACTLARRAASKCIRKLRRSVNKKRMTMRYDSLLYDSTRTTSFLTHRQNCSPSICCGPFLPRRLCCKVHPLASNLVFVRSPGHHLLFAQLLRESRSILLRSFEEGSPLSHSGIPASSVAR